MSIENDDDRDENGAPVPEDALTSIIVILILLAGAFLITEILLALI